MAALTKIPSNVKGNRCQRGNKVQGRETFLVSKTSSGQSGQEAGRYYCKAEI